MEGIMPMKKEEVVVNKTLWAHLLSNGCVRRRWLDSYEIEFHDRRRTYNGKDLLGTIVTMDLHEGDQVSRVWLHTDQIDRPANVLLYTDDPTPSHW